MKPSREIFITIGIVVCIAALCALPVLLFDPFTYSGGPVVETPGQFAKDYTEELLAVIRDKPDKEPPVYGPHGDLYHPDCWEMLRSSMATNSNQYKLILDHETDTRTPIPGLYPPHDFVAALVYVDFPDGTRVEVFYYQNHLDGCVKSPDTYG